MPSSDKMIRSQLRKLARQGRLVDECFKTFQREVYPGAPAEVVAQMRICFFAGAAELWAVIGAAADESDDVSADEEAFMNAWVAEIETFHARTIAAMRGSSTSH